MGKRVDFSARPPSLQPVVGIRSSKSGAPGVAMSDRPERVTAYNIAELSALVANGPRPSGAKRIIRTDGTRDLRYVKKRSILLLDRSWIVEAAFARRDDIVPL
jgi:DNA-directed RNA polymerase beta' subunit